MKQSPKDYFISYNQADAAWAVWIAWVLEENGFPSTVQAWDFAPGSNFVEEMDRAAAEADRTLAVLSPDYLTSAFATAEWAAAFAKDPKGLTRRLLPVRVRECQPQGLLQTITYVDLVDKQEPVARRLLLDGARGNRGKPSQKPPFPGSAELGQALPPTFPGLTDSQASGFADIVRYMPKIRSAPSDLDKRRFIQRTFETAARHFENNLRELANGHEGVESDFKRINDVQFTAELFVNGESRRRCKIWLYNDDIAFSEGSPFGWSGDNNSFNELLSLADNELAIKTIMGVGWGGEEKGLNLKRLNPEEAAEYLWRRFASRLH